MLLSIIISCFLYHVAEILMNCRRFLTLYEIRMDGTPGFGRGICKVPVRKPICGMCVGIS